ncbi:hypothetical protein B0H21DRAFT_789088 [Amylocystis lapponica]|nr:hypothetical protein B0H21DRAFT_789088 [Amylocystis lapponica]
MATTGGVRTSVAHIHRRKSSREDEDKVIVFPASNGIESLVEETSAVGSLLPSVVVNPEPNGVSGLHSHSRNVSSPSPFISASQSYPPPTGQYRASLSIPRPPNRNGGHMHRHQPPALRQSLSLPSDTHSRTRSVSGPYSPLSPSPLSLSFPSSHHSSSSSHAFPASSTAPELTTPGAQESVIGTPASQAHTRRHSRLHSRNLSVFFPQPGSIPSTAIAEDGGQEITYNGAASPSDGVPMPAASPGPGQRSFREGFTFGGRPPAVSMPSGASGAARRGHHHKHSLSHNFFSFLEPGADELQTQPTPIPVSPWMPISPFPPSPTAEGGEILLEEPRTPRPSTALKSSVGRIRVKPRIATSAVAGMGVQFVLGVCLWVSGQQVGSLACTGLGYWVVFDAFGVALGHVLPGYLASASMRAESRRPFGNARIETVVAFAQSVYLLFASVYVCKETVEHMLLSSGEGHHHHQGDETSDMFGIEFPVFLLLSTLISMFFTAVIFNNHSKLVSTAGNHIPPLASLLPSRYRYGSSTYNYPPLLVNLLSNPYALAPVLFSVCILCAAVFVPPHQHRPFDLVLAGVETVVTFSLAYSAAVALGAVLLQTSPARGLAGGRMEAFLRAMREIERHPQVLHLPAPHIWQLTPNLTRPLEHVYAPTAAPVAAKADGPAQSLVVTLELHVRRELEDEAVLHLTRWAWERCSHALHFGSRGGEGGEAEAEVTVGIVRG